MAEIGEKEECKFFCEKCNKAFKLRSSFKVHMNKHEGKHFQCDRCDKTYTASYSLKIHKRAHDNEKPYKCGFCEKRFAHKSHCVRHEKSHAVDETDQDFGVDLVTVTLPTGGDQATKELKLSGLTVEEKTEAEKTEIQRQPKSSVNQSVNQSKPKTLKDLQMKYYQQAIENQRVQMECFSKVSKLADVLIAKFSTD